MNSPRRCAACHKLFQPCPQIPSQQYCSNPGCQRERRRRWQRERIRNDPDYRENQGRAQAGWRARNPDYWRLYRAAHPAYVERNRSGQRGRNACRRVASVAKMDASKASRPITTGFYVLRRALGTGFAKMNACTVHIAVMSCLEGMTHPIAKR